MPSASTDDEYDDAAADADRGDHIVTDEDWSLTEGETDLTMDFYGDGGGDAAVVGTSSAATGSGSAAVSTLDSGSSGTAAAGSAADADVPQVRAPLSSTQCTCTHAGAHALCSPHALCKSTHCKRRTAKHVFCDCTCPSGVMMVAFVMSLPCTG